MNKLWLRSARLSVTESTPEPPKVFTTEYFKPFVALKPLYTKSDGTPGNTSADVCLGSGFIIHRKGVVLTSHTAVTNLSAVYVVLSDGRQVSGRVLEDGYRWGLALIQLSGRRDDWPTVELRADKKVPLIGQSVYTIGCPRLGYDNTVTAGTMAGRPKKWYARGYFEHVNYFSHSGSVNRCQWGGAVVDYRGRVLGMNSKTTNNAKTFCINVDIFIWYLTQLDSRVHYLTARRVGSVGLALRWLDAESRHTFEELAKKYSKQLPNVDKGLLVWAIDIDCDIKRSQINEWDVITHVNGREITSAMDYMMAADNLMEIPVTVAKASGQPSDVIIKKFTKMPFVPNKGGHPYWTPI